MVKEQPSGMRRDEIRQILKRHKGSIGEIAASFVPAMKIQSVCGWLKGRGLDGSRIGVACERKAVALLLIERRRVA